MGASSWLASFLFMLCLSRRLDVSWQIEHHMMENHRSKMR